MREQVTHMSDGTVDLSEECTECGKPFRHIETTDTRKGYDVVYEHAEEWEIECKGCDTVHVVPR